MPVDLSMTITSCRSSEPLYILSMRNNPRADALFKAWIRDHGIAHAVVQNNRLMLHDHLAFERFRITWTHSVEHLAIWDTWSKRHIYLD